MALAAKTVASPDDDLSRFDIHPDDLPRKTRRSTLVTSGMDTDLPPGLLPPGWVGAWFAFTVMNEPVETWMTTAIADGGWEPVPAKLVLRRQAGLNHTILPEDWAGATVERGGQRLYMRPEYLDRESRRDDQERAQRQSAGRLDAARIDNPHVVQHQPPTDTFVEPGVRGMDALAAESEMLRGERRASRAAQDPMGGRLVTSADDIPAGERADIANRYRKADGRVSLE